MWLVWSRDLNPVYHFLVLNLGHGKSKTFSVLVCTAAFGSTSLCPHLPIFTQPVPSLCVTVKSGATPGCHRKKTKLLTLESSCEAVQIHVCLKDQGHDLAGMSQVKWQHRAFSVAVALLCVTTWILVSNVSVFSRCSSSELDTGFCFFLLVVGNAK